MYLILVAAALVTARGVLGHQIDCNDLSTLDVFVCPQRVAMATSSCGPGSHAENKTLEECEILEQMYECMGNGTTVDTAEECERRKLEMEPCSHIDRPEINLARRHLNYACNCTRRFCSMDRDFQDTCDIVRNINIASYSVVDYFPKSEILRSNVWIISSFTHKIPEDVDIHRRLILGYAERHNYGVSIYTGEVYHASDRRSDFWVKMPAMLRVMGMSRVQRTGVSYFMWVDSDVFVTNFSMKIEHILEHNLVKDTEKFIMQIDPWCDSRYKKCEEGNAGIFVARNDPWPVDFLLYAFYQGKIDGSSYSGQFNPSYDDQGAMNMYRRLNVMNASTHFRYLGLLDNSIYALNPALSSKRKLKKKHLWMPGSWAAHAMGSSNDVCQGKQACRVCYARVLENNPLIDLYDITDRKCIRKRFAYVEVVFVTTLLIVALWTWKQRYSIKELFLKSMHPERDRIKRQDI